MSGGIAYVWNPDGDFDYHCNMEMVELSLIEENAARKELYALIRQHFLYTGSQRAGRLIDEWDERVGEFIQVTPVEYMKVMHEQQMQRLARRIADADSENV